MDNWLVITLKVDDILIEPIGDFLIGIVGAGIEILAEQHIQLKTLNAYVEKKNPSPAKVKEILRKVEDHCSEIAEIFAVSPPQLQWQLIEEEDWGRSWKEHFTPVAISRTLIVAPSWTNYRAKDHEKVIIMDPGMAFGTGHHATTELVLQLLEDVLHAGHEVETALDVGTGTGILGMGAALLGVKKVCGIDNDPIAVQVASENIKINRLAEVMMVGGEDITEIKGEFSLVVANIVHDVLIHMARDLRRLTANSGTLILSGILQLGQEQSIIKTFSKSGFTATVRKQKDEWVALLLRRKE